MAMSRIQSKHDRLKCLVVDDHAGFRKVVRDFLPREVVEVMECADGSEAVAAYAANQPDWTLMDIEMPGLDGLRATRAIRERFPDARIIILTHHDLPELREQALEAGACAFLSKDNLWQINATLEALSAKP
jgi:CheY-like chemotaxis protein